MKRRNKKKVSVSTVTAQQQTPLMPTGFLSHRLGGDSVLVSKGNNVIKNQTVKAKLNKNAFSGSLACPVMVNLTKHLITDLVFDTTAAEDNIAPDNTGDNNPLNKKQFTLIELPDKYRKRLLELHDFNGEVAPTVTDINNRAEEIALLALSTGARYAWVGGAPYLINPLVYWLHKHLITPCFSWSRRDYAIIKDDFDDTERLELFRHHSDWIIIP